MSGNLVSLSRFRADVARALARRGKELLVADDLAAAMQGLEPLEAYFIAKELGTDDAVPLLLHATAEQLQTFIDLDCWHGDTPAIEEIDAWLSPFVAAGPEALARVFLQLDDEIQVLFLAATLHVYDLRTEEPPAAPPSVTRVSTPDSYFLLEPIPGEREVDPVSLVDCIYKHSIDVAFRLLMAAKWDAGAPLVEQAYGFRTARLENLGFPTPADAVRIFALPPASPRAPIVPPLPITLPALYARPLTESSLLTRALGRVTDPALVERLEHELVYLVNVAIIGYGDSPRDLAQTTEVAARVRDTLSLGMEELLSTDAPHSSLEDETTAEAAAGLLTRWSVQDLFRHGHRAVMRLVPAARALATDPVLRAWLARPPRDGSEYTEERRDRAFLQALLARIPLHAGWDPVRPERTRAFGRKAELEAAARRLDVIAERYI